MKEKGRVYEEKSNTGELSARKEIRLSMEAVSATSSPSFFIFVCFVIVFVYLFIGHDVQLVESYFPNHRLNPAHGK